MCVRRPFGEWGQLPVLQRQSSFLCTISSVSRCVCDCSFWQSVSWTVFRPTPKLEQRIQATKDPKQAPLGEHLASTNQGVHTAAAKEQRCPGHVTGKIGCLLIGGTSISCSAEGCWMFGACVRWLKVANHTERCCQRYMQAL